MPPEAPVTRTRLPASPVSTLREREQDAETRYEENEARDGHERADVDRRDVVLLPACACSPHRRRLTRLEAEELPVQRDEVELTRSVLAEGAEALHLERQHA